jgi:hypothetical protein
MFIKKNKKISSPIQNKDKNRIMVFLAPLSTEEEVQNVLLLRVSRQFASRIITKMKILG